MPPEQLPVQVVGAVPCNNSYRHVEDFVVFELEEKNVCECAETSVQTCHCCIKDSPFPIAPVSSSYTARG